MTDGHPIFKAGIQSAIDMALLAAITIEVRPDANDMRQRSAVAALRGLADGLKAAFIAPPNPCLVASRMVASEPGETGFITCPACAGRLNWGRDSYNGHIHGQCETEGCLQWMQ